MPERHHQPPPAAPVSGASLQQAQAAFAWLTLGPGAITIDGRAVRGLPARAVPIDEVRGRLAHPACPPALSDAIWAHLIRGARASGATATMMCVGCALPVLEPIARRLHRGRLPDPARRQAGVSRRPRGHNVLAADVESAVLSGFLAELAVVDLRSPGIAGRWQSAAYEAGRRAYRDHTAAPRPQPELFRPYPSAAPAGHPDMVLARAVAVGAITRGEAVLIGSTRLEPVSLNAVARARGHTVRDVRAARVRAERKLATFLRDDHTPDEPADHATVLAAAGPAVSAEPGRSTNGPSGRAS